MDSMQPRVAGKEVVNLFLSRTLGSLLALHFRLPHGGDCFQVDIEFTFYCSLA